MNKELSLHEKQIAIMESYLRSGLQLIPIVGGALHQITFGTYDIIQAKRIQKYLKSLEEMIESDKIAKDSVKQLTKYFETEDGAEFIYLTFEKAKKVRNEFKRECLRDFFFQYSLSSIRNDLDKGESFLELIEILDINTINILFSLKNKVEIDRQGLREKGFDKDDLDFYSQQLIINGLAIDSGMGSLDARALDIISITKRGEEFLSYIRKV